MEPGALCPGDGAWPYFDLSRRVLAAAEALGEYPDRREAALLLLRESVLLAAGAHVVRADRTAARWLEQAGDSALWTRFSETAVGADLLGRLGPTHAALVREAVLAGRGHQLTRVQPERRRSRSRVLLRVARELVHRLEREACGLAWAQTLRRLRILAIALVLALPVAALLWRFGVFTRESNVAFGKPVALSSQYKPRYFPPEHLVDGDTGELGCHTDLEDNPKITIDLLRMETIGRVVVVNRQDMAQERAVPLVIDTSVDGMSYQPFARREDVFSSWAATSKPVTARYVRLSVPRRVELHLNEVEVYAR